MMKTLSAAPSFLGSSLNFSIFAYCFLANFFDFNYVEAVKSTDFTHRFTAACQEVAKFCRLSLFD